MLTGEKRRGRIRSMSSRVSQPFGEVGKHCVGTFWKVFCHVAKSCQLRLNVGAIRVTCNVMCAARLYNEQDEQNCRISSPEQPDCLKHFGACPRLFDHMESFQAEAAICIRREAIFHDLLRMYQKRQADHFMRAVNRCLCWCL